MSVRALKALTLTSSVLCKRCLLTRKYLTSGNSVFSSFIVPSNSNGFHTGNALNEKAQHQQEDVGSAGDETLLSDYDLLYPGHIPTSFFQKSLLSFGAAATAILNPARGDMVATLGETSGYYALIQIRKKMLADPVGRQILEEKPRINSTTVDLDYLKSLPDGTFGREYRRWLDDNQVSPDARLPVAFVDDVGLAYVMTRYREVHDLYHTVLGMPTNWLGEVSVKCIEAIQTGLPMCVLGAAFGPLRFGPRWREKYMKLYLPWAIRCGRDAPFLMNLYFEKLWEEPLLEMRQRLGIEPPPEDWTEKRKKKKKTQ